MKIAPTRAISDRVYGVEQGVVYSGDHVRNGSFATGAVRASVEQYPLRSCSGHLANNPIN
jgi:hypothetical protein